ncbi:MAG: hypothetical protein KIT43_11200 [Bauldia sp.]|nr:hypothetical protein [Bauldia sp.]MCW5716420.1 hypothetical protein [Bauldia sp.]
MSVVLSEERAERPKGQPGTVIGGVTVVSVALVAFLVRIRARRIDVLEFDISAVPTSLRKDVGLPPAEPVRDWHRF